jgi:hypothetical protein
MISSIASATDLTCDDFAPRSLGCRSVSVIGNDVVLVAPVVLTEGRRAQIYGESLNGVCLLFGYSRAVGGRVDWPESESYVAYVTVDGHFSHSWYYDYGIPTYDTVKSVSCQ